MPYEVVILAFIMLVFCFFMQILTIKVMLMLFKANGADVKPIKVFEKPKKPIKKQKITEEERKKAKNDEILLHNYEVYDGTSFGQEDFE